MGFALNCQGMLFLCYQWSNYNISKSNVSKYSITNTFNFCVGKYYMKKIYDISNFDNSKYSIKITTNYSVNKHYMKKGLLLFLWKTSSPNRNLSKTTWR